MQEDHKFHSHFICSSYTCMILVIHMFHYKSMLNSIADNIDLDEDDEVRVEQISPNLEGKYFVFLLGSQCMCIIIIQ